ncbi:MAG: hypothetical protein GIKADHBN_02351 [Phycisphaerales bacterium]|nr:hypothetical protein [Phycisphaerales bacterium]
MWNKVVEHIVACELAANIDAPLVARYGGAWSSSKRAEEFLNAHGETSTVRSLVSGRSVVVQWPHAAHALRLAHTAIQDTTFSGQKVVARHGMRPRLAGRWSAVHGDRSSVRTGRGAGRPSATPRSKARVRASPFSKQKGDGTARDWPANRCERDATCLLVRQLVRACSTVLRTTSSRWLLTCFVSTGDRQAYITLSRRVQPKTNPVRAQRSAQSLRRSSNPSRPICYGKVEQKHEPNHLCRVQPKLIERIVRQR